METNNYLPPPLLQILQLSGMIKKEQINFGNIVIMMSKLAQSQ